MRQRVCWTSARLSQQEKASPRTSWSKTPQSAPSPVQQEDDNSIDLHDNDIPCTDPDVPTTDGLDPQHRNQLRSILRRRREKRRDEVSNYKLHGSGILTLPQGCKLHTGYSTLTAYQSVGSNITYPIIIPDIRTEYFEYCIS